MRIPSEGLGHDFVELRLHFVGRLPGRETRSVADAKYVRVDRECLLAEGGVQHHIGGLAANAW